MLAVAIIPARYGSTRFPGKPLAAETGKPLIQHVYENVARARRLSRVIVATDDERIAAAVRGFGGEVAITRGDHATGTDRVAEAAAGLTADLIVNVQGDEPEMEPEAIDALVEMMASRPEAVMGSLACRFTRAEDLSNPACVKVVLDAAGDALYFSRSLIPYPRDAGGQVSDPSQWLLHLGIYAYRPAFLAELTRTPPTDLERIEQLEQLRVLYMGRRIAIAVVDRSSTGIDTPEQYADFVARYRGPSQPVDVGPNELVRGGPSQIARGGPNELVHEGPSQLVDGGPSELVRGVDHGPWRICKHTPPHLLLDDTRYFVSASSWRDTPFFIDPVVARAMGETIEREYQRHQWILESYVVMPTHYHVVARSRRGTDLPSICKRIHRVMSAFIRNILKGRPSAQPLPSKYFNNYWDRCLRTEAEWLDSLEYIGQNPVRSGLVQDAQEWPYRGPREGPPG